MKNRMLPNRLLRLVACVAATWLLYACAPVATEMPSFNGVTPPPPQTVCGLSLNDLAGWRGYLGLAKEDPSASSTLASFVRSGNALFDSWDGMDTTQVSDILTQEPADTAAAIRRELVIIGLNVASGRLNRASPISTGNGATTVGELIAQLEQALASDSPDPGLVSVSQQLTQVAPTLDQVCARVVTVENDTTIIEKWWTPSGVSQRPVMQLSQDPAAPLRIAGLHHSPDYRYAIVETTGHDCGGPLQLLDLTDGSVIDLNERVGLTVSASGNATALDSEELWQVIGWHPDGNRVLVTAEGQDAVYWLDVSAASYERIALPDGGTVVASDRSITLRPDGEAFVYVDGGGSSLWLYDMSSHQASVLYRPRGDGAYLEYPRYSPDSSGIALLVESGDPPGSQFSLELLDPATGTSSLVAEGDLGLAAPLWSEDGQWLAFSRGSGNATDPTVAPDAPERFSFLWAFNPATQTMRLMSTTGADIRTMAWAPGGTALAYTVGSADLSASPIDEQVQPWQTGEIVSLAVPGSAFFIP